MLYIWNQYSIVYQLYSKKMWHGLHNSEYIKTIELYTQMGDMNGMWIKSE